MPEGRGERTDQWLGVVALVIAGVLTLIAGVRLIGFAGTSIFFVDECWHALVARMMADAKGLVTSTTEMMAGRFHMDYPPLFHLLNAAGYRWLGSTSLVYFNLVVAAALLALILIGPGRLLDPVQRATVALALLAAPLFAMYSIRFYVEMLTAAVFFCSWWWFALALRDGRRRDAVIAGIATGLLVWTKQTGLLVLGLYGAFWAWTVVRGNRAHRVTATWVVGLATILAAGYLGVTMARGENPLLFAVPTSHSEVWEAAMGTGVRVPHGLFFHTLWATWGVLPFVLMVLPLAVLGTNRRRDYPYGPLLALLGILVVVFLIDRRLVERHTLFLLPLLAFLGVDALTRLGGRRGTWAGFTMILLAAVAHVVTMPNYRVNFNPSRDFVEMARTIAQRTPPDATIASVWWVELRYHTGRRVLWPLPHLEDPPVELFSEQSADTWYERLRARGLDYLLVDDRYISEQPSVVTFSRRTLANLDVLVQDGRAQPIARAGPLRLFQVR
ncbi:MAG: hypothetical protein HY207_02540 [Nitrospirae bacterium]|nr:hypothetical protein [Nitrospirota bacterium]